MYVCKSSKGQTYIQMELSDFVGKKKREVVFDLDVKSQAKQAKKVLRPKGLSKRKKSTTKNTKTVNQDALSKFTPIIEKKTIRKVKNQNNSNILSKKKNRDITKKTTKTTKTIDLLKISPASKKKENVKKDVNKDTLKKEGKKKIKKKPNINKEKKNIEKPVLSSEKEGRKDNNKQKIKNSLIKKSKKQNIDFTQSKNKKPILSKNQSNGKNIENKDLDIKQILTSEKKITESMIKKFGKSGQIEIECPLCGNNLYFSEYDIDSDGFSHIRYCEECDSVGKISMHEEKFEIFKELGISSEIFHLHGDWSPSNHRDSRGRSLNIYTFENY